MPLRALTATIEIAQDIEKVFNAILPVIERGMAVQVENQSSVSLVFNAAGHDSGEFTEPPAPSIPPRHVATFGVKGLAGVQGRVDYFGSGVSLTYNIEWGVPLIGENTSHGRLDGGFRSYCVTQSTVGGGAKAVAKHVIFDAPTESGWKRCAKCACLVRRLGADPAVPDSGIDAVCITGGTHDPSVSRDYRLLIGAPGLWRECSQCSALIHSPFGLAAGACHAGGTHVIPADRKQYQIIGDHDAPGESGWQHCGLCNSLVHDVAAACPIGGNHVVVPALAFRVVHA